MQKTAQKIGLFNRIREMANIPGAAVEGFFEPEMKRVMDSLRKADDNIRTIMTGQKIGKATVDVPTDSKSLKDMLKSTRSNFNRREYMTGVADLGRFHKRMYDVSRFIETLRLSVDEIHNNFLFQGLKDKEKEQLQNLRQHMSTASESMTEYFIKEAGVMDFFVNIGTKRGRALAAWEKKYPKVAKDIREGGIRLLDHAESVLANTISLLKEMATARATRKVDSYMDSANKIQIEYKKFDAGDKGFRAYYKNIVEPWLAKFDAWTKRPLDGSKTEEEETGGTPTGVGNTPIGTDAPVASNLTPSEKVRGWTNWEEGKGPYPTYDDPRNVQKLPPPPLVPNIPSVAPRMTTDPGMIAAPPVAPPSAPPEGIEFKSDQIAKEFAQAPQKTAHIQFMKSLEKMAGEDPRVLAGYISKYAKSIQDSDLETAIELFSIVKQLKQ